MDIHARLQVIEQELQTVENMKRRWEQRLAAFWEHLPPIDPEIIQNRMMNIRNKISFLEDRKHKIQERQDLIVQAVIRGRQGD
jgi:hypothetical protein